MQSVTIFFASLVALLAGAAAAQEDIPLEGDARGELALTIYQEDFAVVHDTRRAELPEGESRLVFKDVARVMAPETAIVRADRAQLIETTLQIAPLTPQRLAAAAVGETVQVYRTHPRTGEDRMEPARILSAAEGVVLEIDGRIESLADLPGRLVFPELPEGLTGAPQIAAVLDVAEAGERAARLTYQTGGLGWQAEYIAFLAEDENSLELTAMVTLANSSGLDIREAAVELVAGEVKRVGGDGPQPQLQMMRARAESASGDTASTPLHDVHLYRLDRPLTLADGGQKQIRLFGASEVPAEKTYRFEVGGLTSFDRLRPAQLKLAFANREGDGLGRPLPAGTMRVYAGGDERLRLLGEDRLPATPKGQRAELTLGPAFDVTVEGEANDRNMLVNTRERRVYEADQSYLLRNAGDREVVVDLKQHMPGRDWEILEESRDHAESDADSVTWQVPVPAEGETRLSFTLRVEE